MLTYTTKRAAHLLKVQDIVVNVLREQVVLTEVAAYEPISHIEPLVTIFAGERRNITKSKSKTNTYPT